MTTKNYLNIAEEIVKEKYPNCHGALMAGSIVRGEGTATSDIDLIIYDKSIFSAYRTSFYYRDVPIEVFVHNENSFDYYFNQD